VSAIIAKLGGSEGPSADGKVRYRWRFRVGDDVCAIWDYRGVRWSYFGPSKIFCQLFGARAVIPD
jgi:hypothetical protein